MVETEPPDLDSKELDSYLIFAGNIINKADATLQKHQAPAAPKRLKGFYMVLEEINKSIKKASEYLLERSKLPEKCVVRFYERKLEQVENALNFQKNYIQSVLPDLESQVRFAS